jgi:hypothetical protein
MNKPSASAAKQSNRRMTVILVLVVAAALAIALATTRIGHGAAIRSEESSIVSELSAPSEPTPLAASSAASTDTEDGAVSGEVLETMPVSKYTYLRLRGGGGEVWAAVPSAAVTIGSRVTIANATRMDDFKSATLGRTFKIIYFGVLAPSTPSEGDVSPKFPVADDADPGEVDPDAKLPPGHPDIGVNSAPSLANNDSDALPAGHPNIGANGGPTTIDSDSDTLPSGHPSVGGASPHGGATDSMSTVGPPLAMPRIERARGGNGYLIAELGAQRQRLAGQRVRVRGQVTKVTPDVQGHTFLHLRDGSAIISGPVPDLVVTMSAEPRRGQVATFEGVLRSDVDIGIGYKYPLMLEDAAIVDVH